VYYDSVRAHLTYLKTYLAEAGLVLSSRGQPGKHVALLFGRPWFLLRHDDPNDDLPTWCFISMYASSIELDSILDYSFCHHTFLYNTTIRKTQNRAICVMLDGRLFLGDDGAKIFPMLTRTVQPSCTDGPSVDTNDREQV
jgi:hypothetical protein